MRVIVVGDSPTVSTGFSRCTDAAAKGLLAAGHEVHILGINAFIDYDPGTQLYPCRIYPCVNPQDGGREAFGFTRLPVLVERVSPDLVILINDPWNVQPYVDALKGFIAERAKQDITVPMPKIAAWLAVDACNQPCTFLNSIDGVAVWTEFAARELRSGGLDYDAPIIPLGVDHHTFNISRDRRVSRLNVIDGDVPLDSFIIGVVGRNQPRKRLDLTLWYFAEWLKTHKHEDAWLYLHVAPTGEKGADIRSLVNYFGLSGRVLYHTPHIGKGVSNTFLADVYRSFSVYVTTSQGEGWGLPTLEAMACGVPCIVPNWSALGDLGWVGDAAIKVACTSIALNAPLNSSPYTIGGVMDRRTFIEELESMYRSDRHRLEMSNRARRHALLFDWNTTSQLVSDWANLVMLGTKQHDVEVMV